MPFTGAIASTGMVIWAAVGLAGLTGGMVTVGIAWHRNQPEHTTVEAAQPIKAENAQPVTADSLSVGA